MELRFDEWVISISQKYKRSQIKAACRVNSELLYFYFELGKEIFNSSFKKQYGASFFTKLSVELKKRLPNSSGFSARNLAYIESFYILYRKILPQLVAKLENNNSNTESNNPLFQIPWGHHRIIIDHFKNNPETALFYAVMTIHNNWSRSSLENYISAKLHKREGLSINNFGTTLNGIPECSLAQISKDPYYFDFAELREDYDEKELKKTLVDHIREFLIELGTGFAFIGQEYRIHVGESDFYIDLLFYHYRLHSFVVLEIKTTKFKPEYLGQLNFYVAAIDRDVKGQMDGKTIGLLLCRDKDGAVAKYSLDNYDAPLGVSSYDVSSLIPDNLEDHLHSIEMLEKAK